MNNDPAKQRLLEVKNLEYCIDNKPLIQSMNINIAPGEHCAVVGPSGSGKSTLLHLMAGLTKAKRGEIYFRDKSMHSMSESEQVNLRRSELSFVYQQPQWLRDLTVIENLALPLWLQGKLNEDDIHTKAKAELDIYELLPHANKSVAKLSGGERQRLCLARATIIRPSLVFADEPTGHLDKKNTQHLLDHIKRISTTTTLIIATHDERLLKGFRQQLQMNG